MARKLPPPNKRRVALEGMKIHSYTVGDWCPDQHAIEPPEAVALSLDIQFNDRIRCDVVMRLKTPQAVDTLIQSLLRHKRSVWPEAS